MTRAGGAAWLRDSGLAVDDDGFLRVGDTLQVAGETRIFAAGDCASMIDHPREKAGVFAVHGPPLAPATCGAPSPAAHSSTITRSAAGWR